MSDTCHELLLRLAGRLPDDLLWRYRDWAASDAIRDTLAAAGVVVEDGADGASWSLKRG